MVITPESLAAMDPAKRQSVIDWLRKHGFDMSQVRSVVVSRNRKSSVVSTADSDVYVYDAPSFPKGSSGRRKVSRPKWSAYVEPVLDK